MVARGPKGIAGGIRRVPVPGLDSSWVCWSKLVTGQHSDLHMRTAFLLKYLNENVYTAKYSGKYVLPQRGLEGIRTDDNLQGHIG